jgi:nucleoside-diphosphate-sugar epimerase
MSKILILGFSGYLGTEVQKLLPPENTYLGVSRTSKNSLIRNISPLDNNFHTKISEFHPDLVLNIAGSWINPKQNIDEIRFSNFTLPKLVSESLIKQKPIWYQINSYYNYYFDKFGVDKDQYSYFRRTITDYLNNKFNVTEFRLPHIVGSNDSPRRIFPLVITNLLANRIVELTSGNQYLPIVHVSDAAKVIVDEMNVPSTHRIDISPVACETIKSFGIQISEMLHADFNVLKFGALSDLPNEMYDSSIITLHSHGLFNKMEKLSFDFIYNMLKFL